MKTFVPLLCAAAALATSAAWAENSAKLTDVHLCCKGCVNGVEKAVSDVPGAKAAADQEAGTVTLTGPDAATVQKAADALVKAGYFGKCEDKAVKLENRSGAGDKQVQSMQVEGVHLCCAKCVKAVDRAVKVVPGAKEHNATKGAKIFEVTGDFKEKDIIAALEKEGLAGKVAAK
jgi:copper chaperone CopZ